jgi:hypothetical protein
MRVLQTACLKEFSIHGHEFEPCPTTMPFWYAYLNNTALPDDRYLSALFKGPMPDELWKWPVRIIKNFFKKNPIKQKPNFLFDSEKDLTITMVDPSLVKFLKNSGSAAVYKPLSTWFDKIDPDLDISRKEDQDILKIIEMTHLFLHCQGINDVRLHEWLERQILYTYFFTFHLTDRLVSKQSKMPLPKKLIAGISEPWAIMFRYSVYKSGGNVRVFDHGSGAAFIKGHQSCLGYFFGTHEFKTYTPLAVQAAEMASCPQYRELTNYCQLQAECTVQHRYERMALRNNRKVILIPFYDMRDFNLSTAYPSWIQSYDFNKNLILRLQEMGYHVILKPHPSFYAPPKKIGEKIYGCTYSLQPFEEIVDDAECVVTCDPNSTTIVAATLKGKPIIIVDYNNFGHHFISSLMHKRYAILKTYYTDDNRLSLEWGLLQSAFETALVRAQSKDMDQLFVMDSER